MSCPTQSVAIAIAIAIGIGGWGNWETAMRRALQSSAIGIGVIGLGLCAAPAMAQDEPRFCPNRPSLGASGCVTEPGRVQFEVGAIDWERDDKDDTRQDTVLGADFQARIGVGATTELQFGWTAVGHVRERDKATGLVDRTDSVGDVRLGLRQNLRNPDGDGLSTAIEPFVTLPVGRTPIGNGDWGAGMVLPVTYQLSDAVSLGATGEVDAAVDEDGQGRHLAYSGIATLELALTDQLSIAAESMAMRDNDPQGHTTQLAVAGSLAWQPRPGLQFDLLAVAGVDRDSPDLRLALGGAVLF